MTVDKVPKFSMIIILANSSEWKVNIPCMLVDYDVENSMASCFSGASQQACMPTEPW